MKGPSRQYTDDFPSTGHFAPGSQDEQRSVGTAFRVPFFSCKAYRSLRYFPSAILGSSFLPVFVPIDVIQELKGDEGVLEYTGLVLALIIWIRR